MRVHYESPPESSLESSLGESPLESSLWEFTMIDLYMTVHLRVDQSKAIIWKIFYLSSFWRQLHLGLHLGLVDSQFKCFIGDFFIKANLSLLATIIAERFTWETSLERFFPYAIKPSWINQAALFERLLITAQNLYILKTKTT